MASTVDILKQKRDVDKAIDILTKAGYKVSKKNDKKGEVPEKRSINRVPHKQEESKDAKPNSKKALRKPQTRRG